METVERRLELMKTLCRKRHDTMRNLANEFGVSVRTIQRDIDKISTIIPIYIKTGRYDGGVYVVEGYYMDKMYMTETELNVLRKIKNSYLYNEDLLIDENDVIVISSLIMNYTKPETN